jgi:release factor glutamine methyltransferase
VRVGEAPTELGTRVRDALARGSATLATAGCETPRLDAELLLSAVLGVDRAGLVLASHAAIGAADGVRFEALLARREAREPVAYILGRRAFRRLDLSVDPRVLIPRPETELLVEVGLSLPAGVRVADVGTGSGAVALALADERPDLTLSGLDLSEEALAVAIDNGSRLGLDVRFSRADLLDSGSYDAVLANLPYVEDGSVLAPEIARYEPRAALFGGPDGLELVRRLVSVVAARVEVRLIGLEIGAGQAGAVASALDAAGFASVTRLADLAGHERVIVGRR